MCISAGGLRSAAFGVGALRALATAGASVSRARPWGDFVLPALHLSAAVNRSLLVYVRTCVHVYVHVYACWSCALPRSLVMQPSHVGPPAARPLAPGSRAQHSC